MTYIQTQTIEFLTDLKANNNREWFEENKKRYQTAKNNLDEVTEGLIETISEFDPEVVGLTAKDCVMRIYRDVRFSKDKTPYQTYIGAHIVPGGRKNETAKAGYYFRIEPEKSFLAGGAYSPPSAWINAIRSQLAENPDEFREIIHSTTFKKYFGELKGDKVKTAPKGYAKDHPAIDLLRYKGFLAVHEIPGKKLTEKDFISHASEVFQAMKPFGDYLNRYMS